MKRLKSSINKPTPIKKLLTLTLDSSIWTLLHHNRNWTAILLIEQNVFHSLKIAQRGYVLENGQIALSGAGSALLDNPHIRKTYLGL